MYVDLTLLVFRQQTHSHGEGVRLTGCGFVDIIFSETAMRINTNSYTKQYIRYIRLFFGFQFLKFANFIHVVTVLSFS